MDRPGGLGRLTAAAGRFNSELHGQPQAGGECHQANGMVHQEMPDTVVEALLKCFDHGVWRFESVSLSVVLSFFRTAKYCREMGCSAGRVGVNIHTMSRQYMSMAAAVAAGFSIGKR